LSLVVKGVLELTQPIAEIAIGVTWPIIVLKANEVMAPHETPLRRIAVPKSSAGTAQLRGPLVRKKTVNSTHNQQDGIKVDVAD
jgi:hypothetical protein